MERDGLLASVEQQLKQELAAAHAKITEREQSGHGALNLHEGYRDGLLFALGVVRQAQIKPAPPA